MKNEKVLALPADVLRRLRNDPPKRGVTALKVEGHGMRIRDSE